MSLSNAAIRMAAETMTPGIDDIEARPWDLDQARLELLVFLMIWPALNVMIMAGVVADLGRFSLPDFLPAACRMWLVFAVSLAILRPLQKIMSTYLRPDAFWRQLLLHALVIIGTASAVGPQIRAPE